MRFSGRHPVRCVGDHETTAHGVVSPVGQFRAAGIEGDETHAVRMQRQRVLVIEGEIGAFSSNATMRVARTAISPDLANRLHDVRRWRRHPRCRVRGHRRPSRMALSLPWPLPVAPSEPYSVTVIRATRSSSPLVAQPQREQARRAHRAHGVRARRADADLEQVEDAECHAALSARPAKGKPQVNQPEAAVAGRIAMPAQPDQQRRQQQ